jgi:predicted PurR-regulated permease PerM
MTLQRQILFWLIAIALFVLLLYALRPILLPFIMGLAIAYFLDPVADWLEAKGAPRLAATSIILGVFALVFIAFLLVLLPVLGNQIAGFAADLPGYIKELTALVDQAGPDWLKEWLASTASNIEEQLTSFARDLAGWIATLVQSIWSGGLALLNLISLLVVTPVVAFYMLNDWDRMVASVDRWLPRDHADTLRGLARQVDTALAGFVRGQGSVCLILGIMYAVGLSLVGLKFGMLIGLGSGLISFIPYVGSIVGLVLAGGVAVVQFSLDWVSILTVVGIFVGGQIIEGYFLSPKLVGDRVGLHPVWLMFALFAFGYLFGFVGLLMAVPMAAAVGVFLRFAIKTYMESGMYLGVTGKKPADDDEA